jgi:hypothetical protein
MMATVFFAIGHPGATPPRACHVGGVAPG